MKKVLCIENFVLLYKAESWKLGPIEIFKINEILLLAFNHEQTIKIVALQ